MTHSGQVQSISFSPGNRYALSVTFASPQTPNAPAHALFSIEPDAEIYVEGRRVTGDEFLLWSSKTPSVMVTIHPDPVRYGLSQKTEFATPSE